MNNKKIKIEKKKKCALGTQSYSLRQNKFYLEVVTNTESNPCICQNPVFAESLNLNTYFKGSPGDFCAFQSLKYLVVEHRLQRSRVKSFPYQPYFFFQWFWGLNPATHICQASLLLLEPLLQPFCF
jgi:hypothetical protein